jgi:hypothetical protein
MTDTIQWHLEDIVRDPAIDDKYGMEIKRRIDRSNQVRTDAVEKLDDQLLAEISPKEFKLEARLNTESPGWAIDRLSILCLKLYHMEVETNRADADNEHKANCLRNSMYSKNSNQISVSPSISSLRTSKTGTASQGFTDR